MATAPSTVKISQMPIQPNPGTESIVPILFNGVNAATTTGAIAALVTKDSIGLPKVENLAPSEMPVSDAQRSALARKMDIDAVIPAAQIDGLATALDGKLDKTGTITQNQVEGLPARLTALETSQIPVGRIDGFDDSVNTIIDSRDDLKPTVIRGATAW